MNKKGFTLIELMGILIVIGIIAVIAVPTINDTIKKSNNDLYNEQINYIVKHAERWSVSNTDMISEDTTYYLTLDQMIEEGIIEDDDVIDPRDETSKINGCVVISFKKDYSQYDYSFQESGCLYSDRTGANEPLLTSNMIPVTYNGTNLVVADTEKEWYNYEVGNWANMVLVKDSGTKSRSYYSSKDAIGKAVNEDDILGYFVWVPRFKYQIWNTQSNKINEVKDRNGNFPSIGIKFEKGLSISGTGVADGTWLTHPAFCTGTTDVDNGKRSTCSGNEVTGIWVAKFETSGNTSAPKVKPGVSPLTNNSLSAFATTASQFSSNETYGLTNKNDAHVMTNSEWGAVTYLSHSIYGNYNKTNKANSAVTSNGSNYTGGGLGANYYKSAQAQSTTKNIFGIYDMAGGKYEYVVGNLNTSDNNNHLVGYTTSSTSGFGGYVANGSFASGTSYPRHYDSYSYGTSTTNHLRGHLGDATREITKEGSSTGWYSNNTSMPVNTAPWFRRNNLFSYVGATGTAMSDTAFRVVLY